MIERYPSAIVLREIKKWGMNYMSLMEWVGSIWAYGDWGWKRNGRTFYVSTAGCSGNEDIIEAMRNNKNHFWGMCFYSWRRGGHYVFKIPKIKIRHGESNVNCKLRFDQVEAIRKDKFHTGPWLANFYGITKAHVYRIQKRKTRKHG